MWSTCSIETGHAWTQAPHVTQSHTDSSGTAPGTSAASSGGVGPCGPRTGGDQRTTVGEDLVAQPHDQQLGREHLAGRKGRTRILAAPALGAGERVEHLLPGQVGGGPGAEADVLLGNVGVVEAQRLEPAARSGAAVPDVEGGGGDVEVL